jgi:hypothetical protein
MNQFENILEKYEHSLSELAHRQHATMVAFDEKRKELEEALSALKSPTPEAYEFWVYVDSRHKPMAVVDLQDLLPAITRKGKWIKVSGYG